MYYLYLYSFGKLPLEPVRYTLAKCFYLHYSTTKLDKTCNSIIDLFSVFGDTVYYRDHAENHMHSMWLKSNNYCFPYGEKTLFCWYSCCACSCCSAHIVYGSDELRCYLKMVLLFICFLGHNLIQYSQFHLTKLWRIFFNRYIFIGYFECSVLICCQGLNVRTLFSMVYLIPCISIMISTCSCILCLSFAIMFLVCGDVTTHIFLHVDTLHSNCEE